MIISTEHLVKSAEKKKKTHMKSRILVFSLLFVVILWQSPPVFSQNFVDPETPAGALPMNASIGDGWVLDFSDEFNSTEVDTTKWQVLLSTNTRAPRPMIGVTDWRWLPENVEVKDGNLVLNVVKSGPTSMRCGSINSRGIYETTYGYFEVRMKVGDVRKGTHSAFWLQSNDMSTVTGNAHNGAEIDVFESAWDDDFVKCVVHIDGYGQHKQANTIKFDTPGLFDDFHVWGFHWTEHFMRIYYNGIPKAQYTEDKWIVRSPEYLWLSNGASFGVEGDQYFLDHAIGHLTESYVDYIRVWKQSNGSSPSNNLIFNGDFNAIRSGWTLSNSDMVIREDENSIDGITCRMPGVTQERHIRQAVDVVPGERYLFQVTGRIHDALSASGVVPNTIGATLKGEIMAGDEPLLVMSTHSNANDIVSGEVTIPEDVSKVTVVISKDKGVAFVDNILLIPAATSTQNMSTPLSETRVYPNPSNGSFTIQSNHHISDIRIADINGKLLRQYRGSGTTFVLDATHDLKPGVYLIQLVYDKGHSEWIKHVLH
jgi:beta-glucanase (GH16 family)